MALQHVAGVRTGAVPGLAVLAFLAWTASPQALAVQRKHAMFSVGGTQIADLVDTARSSEVEAISFHYTLKLHQHAGFDAQITRNSSERQSLAMIGGYLSTGAPDRGLEFFVRIGQAFYQHKDYNGVYRGALREQFESGTCTVPSSVTLTPGQTNILRAEQARCSKIASAQGQTLESKGTAFGAGLRLHFEGGWGLTLAVDQLDLATSAGDVDIQGRNFNADPIVISTLGVHGRF